MKTFKDFLIEKLYRIDADVDMLFKKSGFGDLLDSFKTQLKDNEELNPLSTPMRKIKRKLDGAGYYNIFETDSSIFNSKQAKKAHELNPVTIYLGITRTGNSYDPRRKIVSISLNKAVANLILGGNSLSDIPANQRKAFQNEVEEARIKASAAHEISHWINDSLHNQHIEKTVKKAVEAGNKQIFARGHFDIYQADYEIDALIHGIKQIKRKNRRNWNNVSFEDLLSLYPGLSSVDRRLREAPAEHKKWTRLLKTRMAREGLLNDNMKRSEL